MVVVPSSGISSARAQRPRYLTFPSHLTAVVFYWRYIWAQLAKLTLYDKNKHAHPPLPYHVYKLFFHCELLEGTPIMSIATAVVMFCHKKACQLSP